MNSSHFSLAGGADLDTRINCQVAKCLLDSSQFSYYFYFDLFWLKNDKKWLDRIGWLGLTAIKRYRQADETISYHF
jgi:hypothetical protein